MKSTKLPPFPAGENPFCHDAYHMGTKLGSNIIVMHANFPNQKADYLIVCNTETGERLRLDFPKQTSWLDKIKNAFGCLPHSFKPDPISVTEE